MTAAEAATPETVIDRLQEKRTPARAALVRGRGFNTLRAARGPGVFRSPAPARPYTLLPGRTLLLMIFMRSLHLALMYWSAARECGITPDS